VRILHRVELSSDSEALSEIAEQLIIACFEEESLAGGILQTAGITLESIRPLLDQDSTYESKPPPIASSDSIPAAVMMQTLPEALGEVVAEARRITRKTLQAEGISSEHLLAAMLQFDTPVCRSLQQHGITSEIVLSHVTDSELSATSLPVTFTLDGSSSQQTAEHSDKSNQTLASPARVLDACLNRAREGIRVLEDCARFILNNSELVQNLKDLRHRLAASERSLNTIGSIQSDDKPVVAERDVAGDVGSSVTGSQEHRRHDIQDIVHANARRVQESLRSLEEFGKLVSVPFAEEMKQLRYQSYTVHQQLLSCLNTAHKQNADRQQRLLTTHLCVLVTEAGCRNPWKQVVEACLAGGADMIQLREKQLDDQELLARARWLTNVCHSADALCIINDRPDIAQLSGADGVHLGQDDCRVGDARRLVGPDHLIGLSTHTTEDINSADALAADYLGVGPVFRSITKAFVNFAGLELISEAASSTKPWFAIGGIDQSNISEVVNAGAKRTAVSSVVIAADKPNDVTYTLREKLTA
jgi:thiamine-phosphate pyrophosphorylase